MIKFGDYRKNRFMVLTRFDKFEEVLHKYKGGIEFYGGFNIRVDKETGQFILDKRQKIITRVFSYRDRKIFTEPISEGLSKINLSRIAWFLRKNSASKFLETFGTDNENYQKRSVGIKSSMSKNILIEIV